MRAKKIKPFFIVFYHDLKHPLREAWDTSKSRYEIWKEYDHTMIWDAPYYKVLGYFDDKQEAKQFVQQHKREYR
tara:strand:+ start:345 stop:566 length:222 start_codon:yes stop_codon:yes gene_type:complete